MASMTSKEMREIFQKYTKYFALALDKPENVFNLDIERAEQDTLQFELFIYETCIAHFYLVEMPGCCGMVISTNAAVYKGYRKKGIGTVLNRFRMDIAKALGYSCMLCTDVLSNEPQQKILKTNGWKLIHNFTNRKTKNKIGIHIVDL